MNEHISKNNCTIQHYISWSAIVIGALVAVGLGFLLNLFGMAIGLSAFSSPTEGGTAAFAIGGFLGLLIAVIAAFATAGFASGYLGRLCCPGRNLGIVYGFATWALALILSAIMAGALSKYAAVYTHGTVSNLSDTSYSAPANAQNAKADEQQNARAEVNRQMKPDSGNLLNLSDAAWMMFVVFLLFFIGAFSCCVGAYYGMSCRCD